MKSPLPAFAVVPPTASVWRAEARSCENCRFMYVQECRRYPPQISPGNKGASSSTWPAVEWSNWCGEFQPK